MSIQATAFTVMIASAGDVEAERNIARTVVHEWNAVNAFIRKAILLPVGWRTRPHPLAGSRPQAISSSRALKDCDLLIAPFWTRLGTPSGNDVTGTAEAIEAHLQAGKPALMYFSASPVAPDSVDHDQYQALNQFKADCQKRGLAETYESTSEFHDKLRRHLRTTLNTHPHFESVRPAPGSLPAPVADIAPDRPMASPSFISLTRESQQLLLEAVAGGYEVNVVNCVGWFAVEANRKNFVEPNNPRSKAVWDCAVQELLDLGLLKRKGINSEIFRVSRRGYKLADRLRP